MDSILERINKASLHFLSSISLQETYSVIVKEATKLVGADSTTLFLKKDKGLLRTANYPSTITRLVEPRKRGFTYQAFKEQKAFVVQSRQLKNIHPELKSTAPKSAIFIPLSYNKKSIGTLSILVFGEKKFSKHQLRVLEIFGSYATLAIRKAEKMEEANEALTTRDLFISMAAHELRTPLTAINGYVQLLYSKLANKQWSESRWIKELSWETERLTNLVKELLEVNRIKTGQLNYLWKVCSLDEIINRVVNNFGFNFPERQIIYKNKLEGRPDRVTGDFDKLIQVLNNIAENAARYSGKDLPVTIELLDRNTYLIIRVKDRGKGIDKDQLSKIFDKYYRGDEVLEGMGLGLYLSRDIIIKHRGIIKVNSKLNKGTTVTIFLPKARG